MAPPAESSGTTTTTAHKAAIRARVWAALLPVARTDSRFHYAFSSFIPDFAGSDAATARLASLPAYTAARTIFIAPDNCLEGLRAQALRDGKDVLVSTYGLRRGFWLLRAEDVKGEGEWGVRYAATLDGLERVGRKVGLREMAGPGGLRVDLMVTGTGAVNTAGVRFGKGHGFFDLEWAMLYAVGCVGRETLAVAVAHECQVVEEELRADAWDRVCDVVVTPERTIEVRREMVEGVVRWEKLSEDMVEAMEPLRELRGMEEDGTVEGLAAGRT